MSRETHRWWVDGALCDVDLAVLAQLQPTGPDKSSYTTARVRGGGTRWLDRHIRRLQRDARQLGLGEVSGGEAETIFDEVARANFGKGEGIVRIQLEPGGSQGVRLIGIPRPIGAEPPTWSAITAHFPHDGPTAAPGAKLSHRELFTRAHAFGDQAGVDEVLLLDAEGFLIEGYRSNMCMVGADGALSVPDLGRGGVAGIAREILCELAPQLEIRDIPGEELTRASELIATNAVRAACPIISLDGKPVGSGRPGPHAQRLAELYRKA